jgi:uncharacterized protein YkwD
MKQIQQSQIPTKPQQLLRKVRVVEVSITLVLLGCEPATEFWQGLPKLDVPINKTQVPQVSVQSPAIAEMEAAVYQQINKVRQQNGRKPLRKNEKLARVARNYSQQMARKNFFSHVSPEGSTLSQRVRSAGIYYWVVGENLFKSKNISQPVPLAVKGWMNSAGHRENILYPDFAETGIGIWREGNTYYITQLFMRSPSLF